MTTETLPLEQASANLNISDLRTMMNIIEVISQRGGFKAEELVTVGTLYNRISAFVAAATPAEEEATEEAAEEVVEESAEEAVAASWPAPEVSESEE